jgi:hypothetical protein
MGAGRRPKILKPLVNRFIGNGDSTLSQEFFDLTETQTESMVEPHGVANNLRGKPVTLVAG